jgi:hypothetical protein
VQLPRHDQHVFKPRDHGSRAACGYPNCGAAEGDPVHVKAKPQPTNPWRKPRGQALVEFAIVTPLLLVMLLGTLTVGLWMVWLGQLSHAAIEGAKAGAANPGNSCGMAVTVARQVYPWSLETAVCEVRGQFVELELTDLLPITSPMWPDGVTVRSSASAGLP